MYSNLKIRYFCQQKHEEIIIDKTCVKEALFFMVLFKNKKIMKRLFVKGWALLVAATAVPAVSFAQDKVEAEAGADLVSGYIWRGQDLGNVSIQPSLSVAYKGFSLSAWGSVGFEKSDTKEFDLTLGYGAGGFSVSVTDYWFSGGPAYFHYGAHNTGHTFEAQIGYDFGPVAVNWYANFAGNVGCKSDGDKAYASYFSVSAPFKLGGLDWTAVVGATPWENDFYTGGGNSEHPKDMIGGFAVCEVGLKAQKEVRVTRSWSLPLFAQVVWNPAVEGAYFVAGLSF